MIEIDSYQANLRAPAVVTTGYIAATAIAPGLSASIRPGNYNQLIIYWDVTLGSLTSAELKVEFSPDGGTTKFQETAEAISGGTATDTVMEHTVTASGKYRLAIPIADRHITISVKGTGTVTNSLVGVKVELVKNFA